jgi:glycosyltransferase involved in cell wall biosynthesis
MRPLKIFFSCTGVGIINRGIESFFREAFDGLKEVDGLQLTLYKGAGEESSRERVLWNLRRTGTAAAIAGKLIRRNAYVAEQLSSFPPMVRAIRKHRPDIIFYSDSNLGFQLFRWRRQIGVPFRLLFSNGGPVGGPFNRTDYVQQVAPLYYERALARGEPPSRHRIVPYGINVPDGSPGRTRDRVDHFRTRLNLPLDRPIVLSVGWIAAKQKRMDYVVNELANVMYDGTTEPPSYRTTGSSTSDPLSAVRNPVKPYLVLLGAIDEESPAILQLAHDKLGEGNFAVRSVPYEQVSDYYQAADLFVLASLKEGFGRVFLEALMHGLPVIAHDHPVMRFVLGAEGTFGDLSKPGMLAKLITAKLLEETLAETAARRRETVRQRFSWPVLAPQYRNMFFDCYETVQLQ